MEVMPAIDVLAGRVVRLALGDFERVTSYSEDPLTVVRHWVEQGARRLHIVDLDGARAGIPVQRDLIENLIQAVPARFQVGGGVRSAAAIAHALDAGADRVVLGTTLLSDPERAHELVERHGPQRLVAALDVRDGQAVGGAWQGSAPRLDAGSAARRLHDAGIRAFLVTAIARDGVMAGPDLPLLRRLADTVGAETIIASGGVGSLGDIRALQREGFAAVVVGRALYEGRFTLGDAARAAGSPRPD